MVLATAAELFIKLSMQKQQFLVETWNMILNRMIPFHSIPTIDFLHTLHVGLMSLLRNVKNVQQDY